MQIYIYVKWFPQFVLSIYNIFSFSQTLNSE